MNSNQPQKKKLFKRLLFFAKPYRKYLLLALTSVLLLSIPGPLRPLLIGRMVDKYIVQTQNPSMLLWWSLLLIGVMVLEGFHSPFLHGDFVLPSYAQISSGKESSQKVHLLYYVPLF